MKRNQKIAFLLLLNIILFLPVFIQSQNIGIWIPDDKTTPEEESFLACIGSHQDILKLHTTDLKKSGSYTGLDILWLNTSDTLIIKSAGTDNKLIKKIVSFVNKGGKLVLSNQAGMIITALGIEPVAPVTRIKLCTDQGYGRLLGFHSFRVSPGSFQLRH